MPNSEKQKNPWKRINIKRKPQNSFSVPKKQNARGFCSSKMMTRQHYSQEKVADEEVSCPSTFSNSSTLVVGQEENPALETIQIFDDSESNMDDDEWLTDTSVEQMRSSEFPHLDESMVLPSVPLKDIELASLVFLHHDNGPLAYSTPLSLPDEPLAIPNVSYDNKFIKESDTLADADFQVKSISPMQHLSLPDIDDDVIKESQEKRKDSFAYSEKFASGSFKISEDSDKYTKQSFNEDDEYCKKNLFAATAINKSKNSISRNRKQENIVRNSFKDMNHHSQREVLGKAQNMKTNSSKKTGKKDYRVYNRIKYEDVQKMKFNELQNDELDNNQPQTVALQMKSKVKLFIEADNKRQQDAKILNRSGSFTVLKRKDGNKSKNLSEDVDKSKNGDSFQAAQNIQNEELQDNESNNNQQETATYRMKTKLRFDSILSKSPNSNQNKKYGNEIKNASEEVDNCNRSGNFEEFETPERKGILYRGIKLKFSHRTKKPLRNKDTNKGGNSSEDIVKNDRKDIENVHNIEDKELKDNDLDNNQLEAATQQTNRKINKHVGVDNITQQDVNIQSRSQNSVSLRGKHKSERENSFGDIGKSDNEESFKNPQKIQNKDKVGNSFEDNYNKEYDFEEAQNMVVNTFKKNRRHYRLTEIKRNRRVNTSIKATNSLSTSKNSTSRIVSEDVQHNQNEAGNIHWPRCCLESLEALQFEQTFRILKPIFRDDFSIDSITLLNSGIENKMKCKHRNSSFNVMPKC